MERRCWRRGTGAGQLQSVSSHDATRSQHQAAAPHHTLGAPWTMLTAARCTTTITFQSHVSEEDRPTALRGAVVSDQRIPVCVRVMTV